MATMRLAREYVDAREIGLWLAGVICGMGLMLGITTLQHPSPVAPPAVVVPAPQVDQGVTGGRLGGITSDDTANDWQVKQAITGQEGVIGGRLGGLASADSPAIIGQRPAAPDGGRVGGITSDDTAVDAQTRQELMLSGQSETIGGRLGGLTQSDTPTVLAGRSSGR